jgi:predicted PurR-regulated permease PerM
VIAIVVALYFARVLFLPIAFALTFNALFRPVIRRLHALRLPAPAGAAVVVLSLVALLVGGAFALVRPMKGWLAEAPRSFDAAEKKLSRVREPVRQLTTVASRVEHAADMAGGPSTAPGSQPATAPSGNGSDQGKSKENGNGATHEPQPQPVAPAPGPEAPGVVGGVLGTTTSFVGGLLEVLVLLYLLLASDDLFFTKLLKVMPTRQDKRAAAEVVDEAQAAVLRYVGVTALINLGQALVITLMLWWLKMPNAWMWGAACFVLEFIPYLGATIMVVLLSVVAFATFDSLGHILAAPGGYLVVTTLQNNIVSPYAYGDRLKLNPVAVLIGVLFWWFVWGIGGAFLAVPIIATVRIVTRQTRSFHALSEFLGE